MRTSSAFSASVVTSASAAASSFSVVRRGISSSSISVGHRDTGRALSFYSQMGSHTAFDLQHRSPVIDRIDMLEREILLLKNQQTQLLQHAGGAGGGGGPDEGGEGGGGGSAAKHNSANTCGDLGTAATPPASPSASSPASAAPATLAVGGGAASASPGAGPASLRAAAAADYDELSELTEECNVPMNPQAFDDLHQFSAKQPEFLIPVRKLLQETNERDLIAGANMLRREYRIRLAHTTRGLMMAPFGLAMMPSMIELRKWYELSFSDIYNTKEIADRAGLVQFGKLLRRVYRRHWNTSDLLSVAMNEFSHRENWTKEQLDDPRLYKHFNDLQMFFDMFCGTRTALRLLVAHHMMGSQRLLALDPAAIHPRARAVHFGNDPNAFVGAICLRTNVAQVVDVAVRDALKEFYADDEKDQQIDVVVHGDTSFRFATFPLWVFDVVTALVGEAVRANFVRRERTAVAPTPIRVLISHREGQDDCVIRVEDTAGGMPSSVTRTSMSYLASCRSFFEDNELCASTSTIKEGLGWRHSPIRIPYAAVAASAIGGHIAVSSIDGLGTDRCFYIPIRGFFDLTI